MAHAKKRSSAQPYTKKHSLVYMSRISAQDKSNIFRTSEILMTPELRANFDNCLRDVVIDRLARAEQCLELARRLMRSGKPADEESLRGSVGRAYYSAHHSIRAMVLHQRKHDPDGHQKSLEALAELLKDNAFRGKSGLTASMTDKIRTTYDNRCVADYSPYDMSIDKSEWIDISGKDWKATAQFNIKWAKKLFDGAWRVVD